MAEITLLILGDVHFASQPGRRAEVDGVPLRLGAELVERAIVDARRRSSFDAVAMMGDLVDDGSAAGAEADLAELAAVLEDLAGGIPHIVIPGNHDGPAAEALLAAFGDRPGLHEVKGYRFYSFADSWDENDVGHRSAEAMRRLAEEAARPAPGPLIVLQHNCVYPPIDDEYPYVFADPEPIMAGYRRGEVLLSLNGHYHAGQPLCAEGGVQYYTAPSLHRSPFRYALCRLDGRCVSIEEHCLKLPDSPPLYDAHSHTQYAYCGAGITASEAILRARLFGLAGICVTEHADQLYLTRDECASGHVNRNPDYWCEPRSEESERMDSYRALVEPLRDDYVRLGLELELDARGRVALRPCHRAGWDLMVGAAHYVPEDVGKLSQREAGQVFLRDTERLLAAGVEVLAHPFRFFRRHGLETPEGLYPLVAGMLAANGVAAEINFHTNVPDPAFVAECIRRGVKLALGSDAHALSEVGDFHPHLAVLRQAAGSRDVAHLLWAGPWPPGPREG